MLISTIPDRRIWRTIKKIQRSNPLYRTRIEDDNVAGVAAAAMTEEVTILPTLERLLSHRSKEAHEFLIFRAFWDGFRFGYNRCRSKIHIGSQKEMTLKEFNWNKSGNQNKKIQEYAWLSVDLISWPYRSSLGWKHQPHSWRPS